MLKLMTNKRRVEDNELEMPRDEIPANGVQHYLIPLHFGYFSQDLMHYLAAGSLIVELQLAPFLDVVRSRLTAAWEILNPVT